MENKVIVLTEEEECGFDSYYSSGVRIENVFSVPSDLDVLKVRSYVFNNIVSIKEERRKYRNSIFKEVRSFNNIKKGRTPLELVDEYLKMKGIPKDSIKVGIELDYKAILVERLKELGAIALNYEELELF